MLFTWVLKRNDDSNTFLFNLFVTLLFRFFLKVCLMLKKKKKYISWSLQLNWEANPKCCNYSSDRTWQQRSQPSPVLSSHHWLPTKSRLNSKYLSWPRRSSEAKLHHIQRSWQHIALPIDHSAVRLQVYMWSSEALKVEWVTKPSCQGPLLCARMGGWLPLYS